MESVMTLGQVLEAADRLSLDEQETLSDILQRRIVEQRRGSLAEEIQAARQEFESGLCRPATSDEIMAEVLA